MNLIDNLKSTLNAEKVEKVPVVSVTQVGTVDAMETSKTNWPTAHKDPEQMARLGASLYEQAGLECLRVPFDLNIEAEAMGCEINLGDNNLTPDLKGNLTDYPEELNIPDDFLEKGRIPTVLKSIEILKEQYDEVPVIVGVSSPFTVSSLLLGVENLIKLLKSNPTAVEDVLDIVLEAIIEYIQLINEANPDVITLIDGTASSGLLSPNDFEEYVQPLYTELENEIESQSVLHMCGNTTPIINDLLDCGFNGLSVDETININDFIDIKNNSNTKTQIIGNISSSSTLLNKAPQDVKTEAKEILKAGVDVLAPSCGIAPKTPLMNIKALVEARNEFYE